MVVLHLYSPGTKTIEDGSVMDGVFKIGLFSIAHGGLQGLIRGIIGLGVKPAQQADELKP